MTHIRQIYSKFALTQKNIWEQFVEKESEQLVEMCKIILKSLYEKGVKS